MMKVKPSPYLKELTLLYVEDEADVRELFLTLIKRHFREVYAATNGIEGLELFQKHHIDIIISDIRMPKMDGLEMVKKIKEINPEVFVIFITAFSDSSYLKEALELGVEGYIVKPIDKNRLYQKLNFLAEILHQKREKEEYFELLKTFFDRYEDALALIKGQKIILYNQKFTDYFDCTTTLSELEEKIGKKLIEDTIVEYKTDEKIFVFEVNIKKVKEYTLLSFQDITHLQKELFLDTLTGVYTRKYFRTIFDKFLNKKLCVIFLDIDNFKKINDTYGHAVGDNVLEHIATILKSNLRNDDIIIRWGGEEFMVILNDITDTQKAVEIAQKLRSKIEQSPLGNITLTASFGVGCSYLQNRSDYDTFFKKIDAALYRAKEKGKNRVETI